MLQYRRATTDQDIELMQRLRYRVYCEEKQFLDSGPYHKFRETDQYDQYATHFIFADSETPEHLVGCLHFIDESGINLGLTRRYGRAAPGIRVSGCRAVRPRPQCECHWRLVPPGHRRRHEH